MEYTNIYNAMSKAMTEGTAYAGSVGAVVNNGNIDIYTDRLRVASLQKVSGSSYELIYKPDSWFVDPITESEKADVIKACRKLTGYNVVESSKLLVTD